MVSYFSHKKGRILLTNTLILLALIPLRASTEALPPLQSNDVMIRETRHVVQVIERMHYLNEPIARLSFEEFIENYMSRLDYNRLLFLQSDIEDVQRFTKSLHFFLISGNLYPAFEIFKVYRERALSRIEWISQNLNKAFDFSSSETYIPDRSEAEWPSDLEAADRLWNHYLQYQILNELFAQHNVQATVASDSVEKGETPSSGLEDDLAASDEPDRASTDETVQTLSEIQLQSPERFAAMLAKAKENIQRRYQRLKRNIRETEASDVQEIFLNVLTHMYDPHSSFLSADALEEFEIAMRNSLVGIGAVLADEEGYCTIKELLPGGPASLSQQIYPNDKIVGVGQGADGDMIDVIDMKLHKVVKMIRGKKGTIVCLLIQPHDAVDPAFKKEIVLVRDEIKLTANLAIGKLFHVPTAKGDETVSIGSIEIPSFYGSRNSSSTTSHDVEELVEKLKVLGIQGLILDLRRNRGGFLNEAIELTGLFIPRGPVVQIRDVTGNIIKKHDTDSKMIWSGPLAILVSRHSASASEIVAGALQDYQRALIIGDPTTHGKGTVQAIFEVETSPLKRFLRSIRRTGAAKITIQKFYLPDGDSTQSKGVIADVVISSINPLLPIGESDLPHALSWDAISPLSLEQGLTFFTENHMPLLTEMSIGNLRKQSQLRQESLEEFSYLHRNIEWFKTKQAQKTFSLNLAKHEAQQQKEQQYKKEREALRTKLAQEVFDHKEVLLDITIEQEETDQQLRESSVQAATTEDVSPSSEDDSEKEDPPLDIALRESLRIVSDWIQSDTTTMYPNTAPVTHNNEAAAL